MTTAKEEREGHLKLLSILSMLALLDHASPPRDNISEYDLQLAEARHELCEHLKTVLEILKRPGKNDDFVDTVLCLYRGEVP